MRYYPINLDVRGRRVVVIGGGPVAYQKVRPLVRAGAKVILIAPGLEVRLDRLIREREIVGKKRGYRPGDLRGASLAIAATDDTALHEQIRREATREGVLLNVVDRPERCDFTVPARVECGDLLLTISTGGAAPALAKRLRQDLEKQFEGYGSLVRLLKRRRAELKGLPLVKRKQILQRLMSDYLGGRR